MAEAGGIDGPVKIMQGTLAGYTLRRFGASLLLLLLVLSFTFFFVHLSPGDPTLLFDNPRLSAEHRQSLRRLYGLDRPLVSQYLGWLGSVLLRGDWGTSHVHLRPVTAVIAEHLPATLVLAATTLALQYLGGLALGVAAARRAGRLTDHLLRVTSLVLYSLPVFWTGLMALLLLSHQWSIFPAGHLRSVDADLLSRGARLADRLHHLALPSLVLATALVGSTVRFARSSLLEVLNQDFIRTARASGLDEGRIIWLHALRNAAAPLAQLFGLSLPFLFSGALVVEVVFSWPGLGRLAYDSVMSRDYPVVLAITAFTGVLVVLGNFLADLLHALADPRVRE